MSDYIDHDNGKLLQQQIDLSTMVQERLLLKPFLGELIPWHSPEIDPTEIFTGAESAPEIPPIFSSNPSQIFPIEKFIAHLKVGTHATKEPWFIAALSNVFRTVHSD